MEQTSGSIMIGTRAFSAHLPLTSLLIITVVVALYRFSALRLLLLSGEYRCLLMRVEYVEDIYEKKNLNTIRPSEHPPIIYCCFVWFDGTIIVFAMRRFCLCSL